MNFSRLIIFFAASLLAGPILAQVQAAKTYELESITISGTTRITANQLREQLRIRDHQVLTDEWMVDARTKILGLGLFQDVLFSLKKGATPGFARLDIKFENDENVLSDWAVGGEFGLTMTEPTPEFGSDSAFRSYKFGLVARNVVSGSHRASVIADVDSRGNLVYGNFAYGLPRFIHESIQFDGAISVVEPKERYYETEGFGLKIQSQWIRQRRGFDVLYGAAWYSNTHTRYRLEGWPEAVVGPKFGLVRETRFLGFFPKTGYRTSVCFLPSLVRRSEAVLEAELAGTVVPLNFSAVTVSAKALTIGKYAVTTRAEAKVEIPITMVERGLRSLFYVGIRNGQDHYKSQKITSTETVVGFRYHSTGFIGDINFIAVGEHPWKNLPIAGEQ